MRRSVITVALGLAILAVVAGAAGAAESPLKIAVVDMGKITDNYEALQAKSKSLQEWFDGKKRYLEQLSDYLLLSADNFNEVIALLNAPQPLPEDKDKRLKELQALAAEKEKAFRDLQAKVNRSPQEDEAYKSMCDQFDGGRMRLAEQEAKLSADYRQQIAAARDEFMKSVVNVCESVARAEGFALVLDASVVLYGGTDITDKVLAKLNAK